MKQLRIALIGSRELERKEEYRKYINICYRTAYRLAELGVVFTSGLCKEGMDGLAQKAYSQAVLDGKATTDQFEVYVAEQKNIDTSPLPNKHLAIIRNPDLIEQTYEICLEVLGASHWNNCGYWAKGMHSRNCHQVLGYTLDNPVDAIVTWTPNGNVQGGTATALKIAMKYGIPIFNLGKPNYREVLEQLGEFLKSHTPQEPNPTNNQSM